LPIGTRPFDAESPEVTPLFNERAAVVNFLDDSIQLCLKAPYGYIEELSNSSSEITTVNGYQPGGSTPSPLLATVIEQISSKIATSLSPSDTLAIVSFARRLIVRLAGKMEGLGLLVRLSEKLVSLPVSEILEDNHVITNAVAQEITILKSHLTLLGDPAVLMPVLESSSSRAVAELLDRAENTSLRTARCFLHTCSANNRL
jgi:nucleolar pre-ribosomal-associated protein 1